MSAKLAYICVLSTLLTVGMIGVGDRNAYAWGDYGGYNQGYGGYSCGAYCAGEQDASYDHEQGNAYNPVGSCLPCHSQFYWNNFHEGYDKQWQTYQSQDSNQGSSINIYGNNNYVSTNQYSNQQQNPLQQLAHTVCGFVNCGGFGQGPAPTPYQQSGYDQP